MLRVSVRTLTVSLSVKLTPFTIFVVIFYPKKDLCGRVKIAPERMKVPSFAIRVIETPDLKLNVRSK